MNNIWSYILKRILLMVPTLFGVLLLTFIIIQFVPGGPVEQMLNQLRHGENIGAEAAGGKAALYRARQGIDPEQIEKIKTLYGFDKTPSERFWQMLQGFLRFDLGQSFYYHEDVWSLIRAKLPVSISLGLWTFLLSYLISVPLGIAKAVRNGQAFDSMTSALILLGYAIPGFVLGVLLLMLFAGGDFLQWFPLRGLTSDNWQELSFFGKISDYLWHISLPVIASTAGSFAVLTMLTKNSVLEEISRQYVIAAYAKGLSRSQVLYKHVLRNALIPLVTGFPTAVIAAFFTGSLLIETLFSLDGLGLLSYEAVIRRDYPVVLGSLYFFTLIALAVKLVGDLLYVWIDPRIQFSAQS